MYNTYYNFDNMLRAIFVMVIFAATIGTFKGHNPDIPMNKDVKSVKARPS